MFKIDSSNSTNDNEFQDGIPSIGQQGTTVSAEWLNAVQRELIAVLEAAGVTPNKANNAQVLQSIRALSSVPTGTIAEYGGGEAPQGWIKCDGSTVSRVTFANLFSVIGIHYGSGDGSTTFELPDVTPVYGQIAIIKA
jgi:hypothetical protein